MNDALRHKLQAWVDFSRDMEIDLLSRRVGEASESLPAASSGKAIQEPKKPVAADPVKRQPPPATEPVIHPVSPSGSLGFAGSPGLFDEPAVAPQADSLERIREDLGDCQRCKLSAHRTQIVFGMGNPNAELVFVGEAPGADEDEQGLPFVGRAGKLLNRLIDSVGMRREDVYICNIIKCRPPEIERPKKMKSTPASRSFFARSGSYARVCSVAWEPRRCGRCCPSRKASRKSEADSLTTMGSSSCPPFTRPTYFAIPARREPFAGTSSPWRSSSVFVARSDGSGRVQE